MQVNNVYYDITVIESGELHKTANCVSIRFREFVKDTCAHMYESVRIYQIYLCNLYGHKWGIRPAQTEAEIS